jgi:hypothetical protein
MLQFLLNRYRTAVGIQLRPGECDLKTVYDGEVDDTVIRLLLRGRHLMISEQGSIRGPVSLFKFEVDPIGGGLAPSVRLAPRRRFASRETIRFYLVNPNEFCFDSIREGQ